MQNSQTDSELCVCMKNIRRSLSKVREVGVDEAEGRFGDVSLLRCEQCKRYWLLYEVEYPSYTGSSRWFLALIDDSLVDSIQAENAIAYMASLDWYFEGGHFWGSISKTSGPVKVDLFAIGCTQ